MSTRDSRSLPGSRPPLPAREITQSLSVEPLDEDDDDIIDPPGVALGTRGDQEGTRVDSPKARARPAQTRTPPPAAVVRDPDDPNARIGTQLGSYRVDAVLGKGGMGFVFRAEHVKLGREVALKLLRADYARRRDAVARFIQEARTVNRIRHRNIVDVPDIVELDDGTTFIVMEFLAGTSLGRWARAGVDLPRALAVLVQICDGLAAAHAVGVVHRDLKPDNVMVVPTSDGAELVKLLDFGVAKLVNRDDDFDIGFETAAGSVIGTPAYMSPEQAGGMAVDARSDTYSLGAIMYELFTGQPMFRGRSFGEYVRKHLTERPVAPRQTPGGAAIDDRLEGIITRCLEKDPAARFQTIGDLRDALLGMLGGIETRPPIFVATGSHLPLMPMPTLTSGPMPAASATYPPVAAQVPAPSGATPLWVWGIGAAIAIAIGIGAAMWFARGDDAKEIDLAVAPVPPAPVVAPPPPPPLELAHVKLDSLPAGHVFEAGHSAELCTTPCAFDLDPKAGPKHAYVVRADGYMDATIAVDLAGPERAFHTTLQQIPPPPIEVAAPAKHTKHAAPKKVEPPPPPPPPPPVAVPKPPDSAVPDTSETLDPFRHKHP